MSAPHALIAGAGIGGLTAALCLARTGWRVSLFEKASVLEEAGAGLQLSPNATVILRELGLLPALLASSLQPQAIRMRRARDGATLMSLSLKDAQKRWGSPYLLIHRADLQGLLVDAISKHPNIKLRLGATAAGFAAEPDGVTLAVKRGLATVEHRGDCLIGADGLHSFIRQRLVGGNLDTLRFSGKTAWRALIAADDLPLALRTRETQLWLGPDAHFVHYPLRGGTVVNAVAIINDPAGFDPEQDPWSNASEGKLLENSFVNWDGDAKKLIHATQDWLKWPLFERNRLLGWTVGRVTLLGDAAHPLMPFLAQGAAQAIEDAQALAAALARPKDQNAIVAGLKAYESLRLRRTARIEATSKRQAEIYHLKGASALARDLAMRMLGPERLLHHYDWLYRSKIIHR